MNLQLIIALVVAFVIAVLVFKLLSKTFKLLVFLIIFAVVFGVVYFGYDAFKGKLWQFEESSPAPYQPSSYGCKSDSDCAFVVSPGDCNLVANSCNNIGDISRFFKPNTKSKCSVDSVVLNPDVKCSCNKTPTGSSCEKL